MAFAYDIFKALGDKTRCEIILLLRERQEQSCADVAAHFTELTQPTISHHLKVLLEVGLIQVRKQGPTHWYSLCEGVFDKFGVDVHKLRQTM